MIDQASELRRLVLAEGASGLAPEAPPPPRVTVLGGKGGVGATTLAVNLSLALVRQGRRTLLIDANLQQPDIASHCQLEDNESLPDVLSGRRTLHEVIQRGPAGLQIVPGAWADPRTKEYSATSNRRLVGELNRLGAHTDLVILEAGGGLCPSAQRFALASDLVLIVTGAENISIMDSYAAIKLLSNSGQPLPPIQTIVNRVDDLEQAASVHQRIAQASHRFLNITTAAAATIPTDALFADSIERSTPLLVTAPNSPAVRQIEHLAKQVLRTLSEPEPMSEPEPRRAAS